jgi:hypothetical protein
VQTAFDDLEGTLIIVQTAFDDPNAVCTMKSPFKINTCCLYNEESLQDKQMLFVQ